MKTTLALVAVALAGCSSSPSLPPGVATVTLFGPAAPLDSWTTVVVEDAHVHAESVDRPCLTSAAGLMLGVFTGKKEPARDMGSIMETTCKAVRGKAYGGRGRVALILRRSDDALIVDLPRLSAEETDQVYRKGEFTVAFERPLATPEAVLERGWVRALRTPSGVVEYELFLVLKPVAPGAGYESLQVVSRVETPSR